MDKCENCSHLKCIPMVCRGVMDCDPPEIYCELDLDNEDGECEKYDYYDDYMEECDREDYLLHKWEVENDR